MHWPRGTCPGLRRVDHRAPYVVGVEHPVAAPWIKTPSTAAGDPISGAVSFFSQRIAPVARSIATLIVRPRSGGG